MNFTKKLVAVSAIFLAATLANAAVGDVVVTSPTLTITADVTGVSAMDVTPSAAVSASTGNLWAWTQAGSAIANTDLEQIAEVLVETTMPLWDVRITSTNGGLFKNGGGETLQGIVGSAVSNAKVQLFVCGDKTKAADVVTTSAPTATQTVGICRPGALTGTTFTTGKVDPLTAATPVSIAKAFGKATGITPADMHAAETGPVTQGAFDVTSRASYLRIGVWAGLYSATTTTAVIKRENLLGSGLYTDTYTFTLVKMY